VWRKVQGHRDHHAKCDEFKNSGLNALRSSLTVDIVAKDGSVQRETAPQPQLSIITRMTFTLCNRGPKYSPGTEEYYLSVGKRNITNETARNGTSASR